MSKRGQFYLFDAFFAAVILIVGIGFLVSGYTYVPQQANTQVLVQDASLQLTANEISDLFTTWINDNRPLLTQSYTPAQQIHVWWYNQSCSFCMEASANMTASILGSVGDQYGLIVTIKNDTDSSVLFNQTTQRDPDFLIVNQQVIITDTPDGQILGPDILEVRAWR